MIQTIDVVFPKKAPAVLSAMVVLIFSCAGDLEPVNHVSAEQMAAISSSSASEPEASSSSELEVSSASEQPGSSSSVAQLSSPSETPSSSANWEVSSSSVAASGSSSSVDGNGAALCGGKPYNTALRFCGSDGVAYDKCNGDIYTPEDQFCLEGNIKSKCGGKKYETGQFCLDDIIGIIGAYCGDEVYNVESQLCHKDGILKEYFTDVRDGKRYLSVQIGSQTWMAENLNYDVPDNDADRCHKDDPSRCVTYGRLYDWATALDIDAACNTKSLADCGAALDTLHQGICPDGWHVPSNAEWNTLVDFTGSSNYACRLLKESESIDGYSCGKGGDTYGFTAFKSGDITSINIRSSTEYTANNAYYMWVWGAYGSIMVNMVTINKTTLHPVRCVKDEE
ncbi:MAG: hypothetical protein FWB90_07360 [Fibromonadales bacterium]|nr:hypothetical protein [Fibromonadales bacterium]